MTLSSENILSSAQNCLRLEQAAIEATSNKLDESFVQSVHLIEKTILDGKKLVFTGVGKNVPICLKLAGTFNSTGVPTTFLDPNQALHGDLGLCQKGDLCVLFSNSGETEDLLRLLPSLKRLGLTTIAVTAIADSSLSKFSDHLLLYHYDQEACPLNLAPTASTTAALAIGDALAMVYLEIRGFSKEDFARYHPAGSLGKALLLKVDEIMRTGDRFASAPDTITVQEAILCITKARCGSIALVDAQSGALTGVFSDGDFRRAALDDKDILLKPVSEHMTRNPKTIPSGSLAGTALRIFEAVSIDDLVVVDEAGKPLGLIDGQDMPKLRIV
ncbi:KpsF/GutQ family sugar-phosphate isomerase [Puniceicoccales bacterium CK1056]|uniref:KpsF/GutQ family sugar-phosphate isomerase n=1 Tax=Oceanipulchritudo coccoides TaxID=2706888 RepID=A0A6B2M0N3_9BACT|nr:KpsF/GutQ family sugar-phosphate isomerase [Oceanipulchritudo coccoides]NDV61335.1 KpsF/GutQ family sugar-phosphate isomerase [Oceanipulchritudo coccoides]